jgi:hypothetical protein
LGVAPIKVSDAPLSLAAMVTVESGKTDKVEEIAPITGEPLSLGVIMSDNSALPEKAVGFKSACKFEKSALKPERSSNIFFDSL